ncbi:MAG: flavodoxin domain-containing protein [Clostridia bacterium]|nr:flavodoxin domain-containing protein [Clostridia bacterium]
MKDIVVYESATGFTERYAKWIAEALDCEAKPLKHTSGEEISGFERVVFGGWIMGNGIVGLDKLKGMASPVAVFAVGSTPAFDEVISSVKVQNKLDDTPMFYMVGGFRFEKLGFAKRMILKALKKSVAKKKAPNRQEAFMAEALTTSFDNSSREQIIPLVQFVKSLREKRGEA